MFYPVVLRVNKYAIFNIISYKDKKKTSRCKYVGTYIMISVYPSEAQASV